MVYSQEELKRMAELKVPEYVELNGQIFVCPYRSLYSIWHNEHNDYFPEWVYNNVVDTITYQQCRNENFKPPTDKVLELGERTDKVLDDLYNFFKTEAPQWKGKIIFETYPVALGDKFYEPSWELNELKIF